jgi:ATP-dependent Clp protease ATP-binding subunit ClpA
MEHNQLPITDGAYFILAKSILEAVRLRSTPPSGPHILMAIPERPLTLAKYIFADLGIGIDRLHSVMETILQRREATILSSECILAVVERAQLNENANKCGFVSDEHLLLAILELGGPVVRLAFDRLGIPSDVVRERAEEIMAEIRTTGVIGPWRSAADS